MACYAIGDIQGCCEALEDLLDVIHFDPAADTLWFAGDLVNRGPDSLRTLRLIKSLGPAANSVLGNHDLHLVAVHFGHAKAKPKEGLQDILDAPDRDALIHWLLQRPMLLENTGQRAVLTHAGIPPCWSLAEARQYARELEQALRGPNLPAFLADMYGNTPALWSRDLAGTIRLRVITNYFTRMRLCTPAGELDFAHKEGTDSLPAGLYPWFSLPNNGLEDYRLLFGHWAALEGRTHHPRAIGLDTGCVWGGKLTAYRLEDGQRFHNRRGCPGCP